MIQDFAITCYNFTHKHPSNLALDTKQDSPLTSAACPASTGFSPTVATGLGAALSEAQSGFLGSKAAVCQPTSQDRFSVKLLVCTMSQYGCTSKTYGSHSWPRIFSDVSIIFHRFFQTSSLGPEPVQRLQEHTRVINGEGQLFMAGSFQFLHRLERSSSRRIISSVLRSNNLSDPSHSVYI